MTGRADLLRALATLAEPPDAAHAAIAEALGLPRPPAAEDHAAVFLFGAYPYASVYLGAEGMLGGEAADRVAGFWRALGLVPPAEPDHLAALLGLYASLLDDAEDTGLAAPGADAAGRAAHALLWEHLLSWSGPFLDAVVTLERPFYVRWAALLRRALDEEAARLGGPLDLPLQLREAPTLPGTEDTGDAWLDAILAPVRSGFMVTRADLRRCAIELGVGSRVGERRFMLRSIVAQEPRGAMGWLSSAADAAAGRYGATEAVLGPVAAFWRQRARSSASELARAA